MYILGIEKKTKSVTILIIIVHKYLIDEVKMVIFTIYILLESLNKKKIDSASYQKQYNNSKWYQRNTIHKSSKEI